MSQLEGHARRTQERPLEELAKVGIVGAVGVAFLTYAFVAMWHATPW
jgi:hypothetical protein